jgi:hypothetical protein
LELWGYCHRTESGAFKRVEARLEPHWTEQDMPNDSTIDIGNE